MEARAGEGAGPTAGWEGNLGRGLAWTESTLSTLGQRATRLMDHVAPRATPAEQLSSAVAETKCRGGEERPKLEEVAEWRQAEGEGRKVLSGTNLSTKGSRTSHAAVF